MTFARTLVSHPVSSSSKKSKGGLFSGGFSGGIVGNKKVPSSTGRGPSQTDITKETQAGQKEDEHAWTFDAMVRGQKEGKIRFAVFLAVEVRGKSPKAQEGSSNGTGNGDKAENKAQQGPVSAGPGVANAGGTSGGAGTGGVNVLVKAPVFGF